MDRHLSRWSHTSSIALPQRDTWKEMTSVTYSQRTERGTSQPWQTNEGTELPIRRPHTFPFLIFSIILGAGIAFAYSAHGLSPHPDSIWLVAIAAFVALVASSAIKVADQWDRAVILR